jgi:hypothetical protein
MLHNSFIRFFFSCFYLKSEMFILKSDGKHLRKKMIDKFYFFYVFNREKKRREKKTSPSFLLTLLSNNKQHLRI